MTRIITYTIGIFTALTLVSCLSDDSDLDNLIQENPGRIIPPTIEFDESDLDEGPDIIVSDPNDETYNDYCENSPWTTSVKVNYTASGATVTGTNTRVKATIDGGHVVITITGSRVHIIASGECDNGSLKVYSDYKYKLTLNGLTLNNPHGAPINNQGRKTLYLVVAPDTKNVLTDGEEYIYTEDEDMKAALFSEGQIAISGHGELKVTSLSHNGIASDDYLRFRKGNKFTINCQQGNCMRGKDGVFIDGSVFNMLVAGDASKGITTNANVNINGGRTTIITNGGSVIDPILSDTTSCAGIKSDSLMLITDGVLNILCKGEGGKGIRAHKGLSMTNGNVTIVTHGIKDNASPKGIKCNGTLSVSGGTLYSYSHHASPIDATTISLAPNYATLEHKKHLFNVVFITPQ